MPVSKPEITNARDRENSSPLSSRYAKLVIGGIVLSFLIGAFFFMTIAQQRTGAVIPVDAAPHYYMHDAE